MSAAPEKLADLDQRVAPRERVMLVAKLSFNQGAVSVDCVASNISSTGARLTVSAEVLLAQTMRLSIPQREIEASVRMVRRRGNIVAVSFDVPREPLREAPTPTREKSLEAENRKLRMLLVQMEERLLRMQEGA